MSSTSMTSTPYVDAFKGMSTRKTLRYLANAQIQHENLCNEHSKSQLLQMVQCNQLLRAILEKIDPEHILLQVPNTSTTCSS